MIKFLLLIVSMILVASVYKVYSDKREHIVEIKELRQTKEKSVTEAIVIPKKEEPITPKEKIVKKIKPKFIDRNENIDLIITEKNSEKDPKKVIEDVLEQDNIPSEELDYLGDAPKDDKIPSNADMEKIMKMNLEAIRNSSENINEEAMEKMMKVNLELMSKNPQDITEEDMERMGEVMNPNLEGMDERSRDIEDIEDQRL